VVVIVSVIAGGIVATILILYSPGFLGGRTEKSGSLDITLENRYWGRTVPYYITVDGGNVSSGNIAALQQVRVNVTFSWAGESCRSHWVNGTTWDDGRGSSSDYEQIAVCSGTHPSIKLIV